MVFLLAVQSNQLNVAVKESPVMRNSALASLSTVAKSHQTNTRGRAARTNSGNDLTHAAEVLSKCAHSNSVPL